MNSKVIKFKKEVVSNLIDSEMKNFKGGWMTEDRNQMTGCITIVNHDYSCGCPYTDTASTYPFCTGQNPTNFMC